MNVWPIDGQSASAITPLALQVGFADSALTPHGFAPAPSAFGALVANGLSDLNRQLKIGQTDLQKLAVGDVQNLHQVLIRMEETRIAFQLAMQVRNRLLESYQDIMKMQI